MGVGNARNLGGIEKTPLSNFQPGFSDFSVKIPVKTQAH